MTNSNTVAMEEMTLDTNIKVLYVTATSFPAGVLDAHHQLRNLVDNTKNRKYFGISRPEKGVIVYKAAAEEIDPDETERLGCDTMVIKKGRYTSITINDFMKDIQSIVKAFTQLLSHPRLDPDGYCVEWYLTDTNVKCMIRLHDEQ